MAKSVIIIREIRDNCGIAGDWRVSSPMGNENEKKIKKTKPDIECDKNKK